MPPPLPPNDTKNNANNECKFEQPCGSFTLNLTLLPPGRVGAPARWSGFECQFCHSASCVTLHELFNLSSSSCVKWTK
jgi:hypothetical protein